MSQPQPCAHEFDYHHMFCVRCGQPAERIGDMPEQFGACWRHVQYGFEFYRRDALSIGVRKVHE